MNKLEKLSYASYVLGFCCGMFSTVLFLAHTNWYASFAWAVGCIAWATCTISLRTGIRYRKMYERSEAEAFKWMGLALEFNTFPRDTIRLAGDKLFDPDGVKNEA